MTGACKGSVLYIVQIGLPNPLLTAGYMLTQWCANTIAYGLWDAGKGYGPVSIHMGSIQPPYDQREEVDVD